jgi:PAS domain S-box-containing protein
MDLNMDISDHPSNHPGSILIVDDDAVSLSLLNELLADSGYFVRAVDSGTMAIKWVQDQVPDIILLDVQMPEMDGYEVCRRIKSDPSVRDVPVLFISAHGESVDKAACFDVGGVDFITKPIDIAEVLARINHHLTLRHLHQNLEGLVKQRTEELVSANRQLRAEIKERKRTEAALAGEKALLHCVMDSIPDHIFYKDNESVYLGCNKAYAAYTGLSQKEQTGRTDFDIFAKETAEFYQHKDQELLSSAKPARYEEWVSYPDNRKALLDTLKTPYYGPDGEMLGLVAISRDITEIKQAEEERLSLSRQLRQTQKLEAIGTLAGGIAHDFNNILSSIIGFTELAMDDVQKGSALEDNLEEVYLAGKRAKELVKQILTFSRKPKDVHQPVNIGMIAKEVLKLLRASIPVSIDIKQDIQSEATVMSDPTQIHQIFLNLCTNAAQSMEERGGKLMVQVKDTTIADGLTADVASIRPGNYVTIRVVDTGVGISEKELDHVFEPYFTTKTSSEGTGLGLSVVHGIVKSCGGEIYISSTVSQGSVFTVYLPIAKGGGSTKPKLVDNACPRGVESILVVDDEMAIVKTQGSILERHGYTVTLCTNSQAALALFRTEPHRFDLVLTDMTMPMLSGDLMAQEMRRIRPDIPIILCTGYHKQMSADEALEKGFDAYEMKPLTRSVLLDTVRRVLDRNPSSRIQQSG